MADYSPSGVAGLAPTTPEYLAGQSRLNDSRILGWIREAVQEGDAVNQSDPTYDKIDLNMRYIVGDQQVNPDKPLPAYLQPIIVNVARKAVQAHVSALTDLKGSFGWRSQNPKYQLQAQLLTQLIVAWYISTMSDVDIGDVIKIAMAAGSADCAIEFDPSIPGGGDHVLIAKDPRDTLPIRPGRQRHPQKWQGLTFREVWTVSNLRLKYPQVGNQIMPSRDTLLSTVRGLFRRAPTRFQTPADPLSLLSQRETRMPNRSGDVIMYRTYLTDLTRNLTNKTITLGDPRAAWAVTCEPGALLYPTKRLIVSLLDESVGQGMILYDGPSPYWHGLFPVSRFSPWHVPWQFFGVPLLNDLIPLQDAINGGRTDVRLAVQQWLDQQTVFDTHALGAAAAHLYDARKPGTKIKLRGTAIDPAKAIRKIEGPNPSVIQMAFNMYKDDKAAFDSLAGTGNLEALMQLRQMPGAETIQKYWEALTPEIRQEGRALEAFLRDCSVQLKSNVFQFMTSAKRVTILGDAGLTLEDFDFDPDTLVPASKPKIPAPQPPVDPSLGASTAPPGVIDNPDYDPAFDVGISRAERAKTMSRLMVFMVAPNSLLAMHAQETKMLRVQLARMGYYDFWSLMETLEVPNVGAPPPMPLPPIQPPPIPQDDPVAAAAALAELLASGKYVLDPMQGLLEIREPITVTERLQAQALLGIGMTETPAGRKSSGQEAPRQETKSDGAGGERTTITES